MRRKIYDQLLEWKQRPDHLCLVIKGQRQVGKTYIVKRFAEENYSNIVEIDFSREPACRNVFNGALDVDRIVAELAVIKDTDIIPGSTLLFFDEVQDCPLARTSLKSFSIDGRYDVIASGSLLGVSDAHLLPTGRGIPPLIPMGYEEHLTMTSMDFEEFLWAVSFKQDVIDEARRCLRERKAMGEAIVSVLSARFREFMIVGGMPMSVQAFVKTKGYRESGAALDRIIDLCRNDITRYSKGSDILKTTQCFDSIPSQLSQTNKKFTYSRIDNGTGSRNSAEKYMENLLWIKEAGYGNFCYAVNEPSIPLRSREVRDSFKVYLSDTGLLVRMLGEESARAILSEDISCNQGAVMENLVAECLMKNGIPPRHYRKTNGQNKMEIDFIAEMNGEVYAIEVKSGKSRSAPSLWKVGEVFRIDRKVMFEDSDISVDEKGVEHYPLFASAFIREIAAPTDWPDL